MGSNNMCENESVRKIVIDGQPNRNNEFLIKINELDIPEYCYQKVLRAKQLVNGWGEMKIEILNIIGENINGKLNKIITKNRFFGFRNKKLHINIKYVSPDGVVTESWGYKCKIISINYTPLDYTDDGLMRTILTLKPTSVKRIN